MAQTNLKGKQFFSPIGVLVGFGGAIGGANPEAQLYIDAVMAAAVRYMQEVPKAERCTQAMLERVAAEAKAALPA